MTDMPRTSPRWWSGVALAAVVAMLSACEALITDPAPATSDLTVQFQIVGTTIGGTTEAFAKVNRLSLRFLRADSTSRDTVLAVRATDGRIRTGIVLETQERIAALGIIAELRVGPVPLFTGGRVVQVDPGVPTTAQIPLQPVPARVLASTQTLTLVGLGQTAQLGSAVLYATTDTIEGLAGAWVSSDPTIVTVSPAGLALSLQRGSTDLIVGFAGLADTVRATVQ